MDDIAVPGTLRRSGRRVTPSLRGLPALGWTLDSERLQPLLFCFAVLAAYRRDVRPQIKRQKSRLFAVRFDGRWGVSPAPGRAPEADPDPS